MPTTASNDALQVFNEAGGASLSVLCSYLEVICGEAYEKLFSISGRRAGSDRVMQLALALVTQNAARVSDLIMTTPRGMCDH